ncbi:MAG: N-6 DNA methylase [Candidatus Bathyarchaeia archaeon]
MSREAKVESEFYRLIKNVLDKHGYVIEGVRLENVETQYPVNSGRADLAVLLDSRRPLAIIECKRKLEAARAYVERRDFDPLSSKVIDQAKLYAVNSGAPLFATTNGKVFALFTMPERGEPFRIDRHRLLVKDIQLREEAVEEILKVIVEWHAGIVIPRTPVDWTFIIRLRSFVEWLAPYLKRVIKEKLTRDKEFISKFEELRKEAGETTPEVLAREAAYILMNKIIFYKILERHYGLIKLSPISTPNGSQYVKTLNSFFTRAVEETKDFEPIFFAGFYDLIPLPDDEYVLEEVNTFIGDMDTYRLEEIESDVVGFIYETLIPEVERHQLGQFYTPPQIAELITRWAIRSPDDKVLDPGCGSGTFLIKAYKVLRELKGRTKRGNLHEETLRQLYAFDVNPFPTHLTAMNLAMRDIKSPTSEMNVIRTDFFHRHPKESVLCPYAVRTPAGEVRREIFIPQVDAVVANPPYTRWTEIPEPTKKAITSKIGDALRRYHLTARVSQGIEPGIYIHFIIHGTNLSLMADLG